MNLELKNYIIQLHEEGNGPKAIAEDLGEWYEVSKDDADKYYREALGLPEPVDKEQGAVDKYLPGYADEAYNMLTLGKGIDSMANTFRVDIYTINTWKDIFPDFADAWERAKEDDGKVARSLLKLALGYDQEDVKIFQFKGEELLVPFIKRYQPDLGAIRLWLQSKHPAVWKEMTVVETTITHEVKGMTDEELDERLKSYGVTSEASPLDKLKQVT